MKSFTAGSQFDLSGESFEREASLVKPRARFRCIISHEKRMIPQLYYFFFLEIREDSVRSDLGAGDDHDLLTAG